MAIIKTQSVLLLHYNNYFNRIVKKLGTIAEYKAADTELGTAHYSECENINFVPGDGITTSLVLGYGANPAAIFNSGADYDYLVVEDVEDDDEQHTITRTVNSRWFILEAHRTRDKQYELVLRRDVIADNYEKVINAPIYLEKGYISDVNNPLLYNSEGVKVNQIKQTEIPLKDETESGWVVGYVPSDAFQSETTITANVAVSLTPNITVNDLSTWSYWPYCSNNSSFSRLADTNGSKQVSVPFRDHYITAGGRSATDHIRTERVIFKTNSSETPTIAVVNSGSVTSGTSGQFNYPTWYTGYTNVIWASSVGSHMNASTAAKIFTNIQNNSTFNGYVNTLLGSSVVIGDTSSLRRLDGQIIKDTNSNQYWKIKVVEVSVSTPVYATTSTTAGTNIINFINGNMVRNPAIGITQGGVTGNFVSGEIQLNISSPAYYLSLEQVGITVETKIDSDRAHLNDSPYDMFCIPYSDELQLKTASNGTPFTVNKNVALGIACEIGRQTGSGNLYDIQLLPYCPNRSLILGSANPLQLELQNIKYDIIKDSTTQANVSAIIWCTESTFQIPIDVADTMVSFNNTNETPTAIRVENYYLLPELQQVGYNRRVATSGTDDLLVYKINKENGAVISYDWYNAIEINDSSASMIVYKVGWSSYPQINTTFSEYNAADYQLVFWIPNVGWGGVYIDRFASELKIAEGIGILNPGLTALNRKMSNECDVHRLVAQNHSAIFEFSPAKSGGVEGFIADCTYRPWTPYIHVIPRLKGLYGDNFVEIDDARGLICGGDMSLPQLSNEWANYTLQNKTYQEMFDRQIKNMDTTNEVKRQEALAGAILGTVQGTTTGAASGAMVGGGYGAIAGAVIGGISSSIGGGLDYTNTLKLMEENKSYAIDMYNYNLQNIQAIPSALTKTSALTYNTRIWPFVEYYTCTATERNAIKDKITYNGMTIMAISKLSDYIESEQHYFKGQLIRLEDANEDGHIVYEIYNELNKGVYI